MVGAIAGDVIGSVHESAGTKTTEFPLFTPSSRFTDDTVLTVAVAHAILRDSDSARAGSLLECALFGASACSALPLDWARPATSSAESGAEPVEARFDRTTPRIRSAAELATPTLDTPPPTA